ncbi:hypothetical protein [Halorientalis sp.]|uniref:hypothetical protein n=1 Tax=Halorientalis sp. TaxID=1931229 RepID=UPI0026195F08|nr:hypothetical protein [Halorientalis sp.]
MLDGRDDDSFVLAVAPSIQSVDSETGNGTRAGQLDAACLSVRVRGRPRVTAPVVAGRRVTVRAAGTGGPFVDESLVTTTVARG